METTKKEAAQAVNTILNTITKVLKNKDSITLPGFGSFNVRERAERKGRNLQTGKEITIPAKYIVRFKAGKTLKNI